MKMELPRWPSAAPTVALTLLLGVAAGVEAGGSPTPLARAGNEFAFALQRQLARQPGNRVLSPFSLSVALTMTYPGARGQTASEMQSVLGLPAGVEVHEALGAWFEGLASSPVNGVELTIASALWPASDVTLLPPYRRIVRESYGASPIGLDVSRPVESAAVINRWIEERTGGRITDLIDPGGINPWTRLILTNAIYFRSNWRVAFRESATTDQAFHRLDGTAPAVPTMTRTGSLPYVRADGVQVLELPYADPRFAMVILLPDEPGGLRGLEWRLGEPLFQEWMDALTTGHVAVSLPRFSLRSRVDPVAPLEQMGMRLPFQSTADFSGMSPEPLFISRVVHQATIDVAEQGTEAAAATGVHMELSCEMIDDSAGPVEFRVDHPFVFLIRDRETGGILFLGRVTDPAGS